MADSMVSLEVVWINVAMQVCVLSGDEIQTHDDVMWEIWEND